MKIYSRILCIALTLLMLCSCLYGCVDKQGEDDTTDITPAGTTGPAATTDAPETEATLDIPSSINYDYEFNVLIQDVLANDFLTEDHDTEEPLHDAVRRRNMNIEDLLGITINVETMQYNNVTSAVRRSVDSGSDDYDIALVHMLDGSSLALDNSVVPFEKLPYVDLTKPWWDKAIKNGFSINNNQMMANGDISPTSYNVTSCLFFNKALFDDYDLEDPYQLVRDGKWTLDVLYELTRDMSKDLSGDGKVTKDSTNDQFGLTSWYLDVPYSFYYGAGGMLVKKDSDDYPELDLSVEKNLNIVTKIEKVILDNQAHYETVFADYLDVSRLFADGRALFYDGKLESFQFLREMDDDFGILPIPKYDEAQADYCSFVNGCANMLVIPASASNLERTSVIVEALAYESYKVVSPVLFEQYLKRKSTRDAESVEMVDIIVRNRVFDMGYVNLFNGVGSFVQALINEKSTDVASTFKKYEKSADRELQNIVDAFEESRKQ